MSHSAYLRFALSVHRPLGLASTLFGVIAFLGYAGGIESLYRPIEDGPATHPITALCAILLGGSIFKSNAKSANFWAGLLVLLATLLVISDKLQQTHIARFITPFYQTVTADLRQGLDNSMGLNTALMYFFLSVSLLLRAVSRILLSQIIGFLTLALPTISFVGYAYGLQNFHGQMSLLTAIIGVVLSTGALFCSADKGPLNSMLSKDIGGRVARTQVLFGYLFPFAFGFLISRSLSSGQNEAVSLVIVAISWSIVLLAAVTAIVLEKIDENLVEDQSLNATRQMQKYEQDSKEQ